MAVPYYIGAKVIAARLGYKSPRMVDKLVRREGLPVHKRVLKSGTGAYRALAISESVITAWEVSKGLQHVNRRRAEAPFQTKPHRSPLAVQKKAGVRGTVSE